MDRGVVLQMYILTSLQFFRNLYVVLSCLTFVEMNGVSIRVSTTPFKSSEVL